MPVLYQPQRLGNFHHQHGYARKAYTYKIPVIRKVGHAESGNHAGGEQYERDKRRRYERYPIQLMIGKRPYLKQRMLRTHVVSVYYLRQRKGKECKGTASLGGAARERLPYKVSRQRERRTYSPAT